MQTKFQNGRALKVKPFLEFKVLSDYLNRSNETKDLTQLTNILKLVLSSEN